MFCAGKNGYEEDDRATVAIESSDGEQKIMSEMTPTPEEIEVLIDAASDAVRREDSDSLMSILGVEFDVDTPNNRGDTLLMLAAYHGNAEACRILLLNGADPNRKNKDGQPILLGAAYKGFADVARLLLENGADLNATDNKGQTARAFATMFAREEVLAVLDEYDATPPSDDT